MNLLFIFVGIFILLIAGDFLVKASISLSIMLSVSPMVIGFTVISFGTSVPELVVGVQATWSGFGNLALGNIVGSNIANSLLVLGLPALIIPIRNTEKELRTSYFFMFLSTILFSILVSFGDLTLRHGIFFLVLQALVICKTIKLAKIKENSKDTIALTGYVGVEKIRNVLFFGLFGFIGLPLGANLLISGATGLAKYWSVSDEIIGLTVIALGTSLPELATAFVAAIRRQSDLLLGNVIGSNLFNILGIVGLSSLFGNLGFNAELKVFSLGALLISTIILIPFTVFSIKISRFVGFIFIFIYILCIMTVT